MALVLEVYRSTAKFPREEMFGLTSQLRRAAVSVASNIAEGKGRFSDRELSQFLAIARGSLFEIETQVAIAMDLGFLGKPLSQELLQRCAAVGRLLNGLIRSVRKPAPDGGLRLSGFGLRQSSEEQLCDPGDAAIYVTIKVCRMRMAEARQPKPEAQSC